MSISAVNVLTLRLMAVGLPLLAVGASLDAQARGWGLFNVLELGFWAKCALTILLMDLAIWAQHLVTHKVPLLWRLHRVHHADRDMDVTTAIRFHPIEIALSMLIKIGVVYALGAPAMAVVLFEIMLNGTAMFNHSNLRLPLNIDRILRVALVTPDMHRVHHSNIRAEHDTNFGFALSVWDRIFKTYTPQPSKGHDSMTIGLDWQTDQPARLGWVLKLPFR
ncbi:MAG: sterol desaturase family protein [Paracoccaceae bacterium]